MISHPSGIEFRVLDSDPRHIRRLRVRLPNAAKDAAKDEASRAAAATNRASAPAAPSDAPAADGLTDAGPAEDGIAKGGPPHPGDGTTDRTGSTDAEAAAA